MSVTFLNYNYNVSLKINLMCLWLRNLGSSYLHTEMAECQIPGEIQEDSRMASFKIQDLMGDEGACMSTLSGRAQVV
jgi:hypothetical protein